MKTAWWAHPGPPDVVHNRGCSSGFGAARGCSYRLLTAIGPNKRADKLACNTRCLIHVAPMLLLAPTPACRRGKQPVAHFGLLV